MTNKELERIATAIRDGYRKYMNQCGYNANTYSAYEMGYIDGKQAAYKELQDL